MASSGQPGASLLPLSEDDLHKVYAWVDQIPLSRPKKSIGRDFSDGVLVAEVIAFYFPKLADVHNYAAANSVSQKIYNWDTLNSKVFRKLKFSLSREDIEAVANSKAGAIEKILFGLQLKLGDYRKESRRGSASSDGDGSVTSGAPRRESTQYCSKCSHLEEGHGETSTPSSESVQELKETVSILEQKVMKLEQLIRIKDTKIARLQQKLQGFAGPEGDRMIS